MQESTPLQNPAKPSPWGNYVKEFIMLFLAISLGFFVENLRQDYADREVERDFMISLLEDLKDDSTKIVLAMHYNEIKMAAFDSLLIGLLHPPYNDSTLHLIYYLQRKYTGSNQSANLTERTLKQLSSTGAFRLIRSREIAGEITHYQEEINAIHKQGQVMIFEYQLKAREISSRLFDAGALFGLTRETAHILLDPNTRLKQLSGTGGDVNEYSNWLISSNGTFFYYQKMLERHLAHNIKLLELIKKEYNLPHPQNKPFNFSFLNQTPAKTN